MKGHIDYSCLLEMIRKQIDCYGSGRTSFPSMVSQIDAYISGLSVKDCELKNNLRDKWRVLEEVNALALDEGSPESLPEHLDLTNKTLDDLLVLVFR